MNIPKRLKKWEIAKGPDGEIVIEGVDYSEGETIDVRNLVMFKVAAESFSDMGPLSPAQSRLGDVGFDFVEEACTNDLIEGGSHTLSKDVVKRIFRFWSFNDLISKDQVIWEIGCGVPKFMGFLGTYFRHVVGSDVDLRVYSGVVNYFESLRSNEKVTVVCTHERCQIANTEEEAGRNLRKRSEKKINYVSPPENDENMDPADDNKLSSDDDASAYIDDDVSSDDDEDDDDDDSQQ